MTKMDGFDDTRNRTSANGNRIANRLSATCNMELTIVGMECKWRTNVTGCMDWNLNCAVRSDDTHPERCCCPSCACPKPFCWKMSINHLIGRAHPSKPASSYRSPSLLITAFQLQLFRHQTQQCSHIAVLVIDADIGDLG